MHLSIAFFFTILYSSVSYSNEILIGYPETSSFYRPFYSDLISGIKKTFSSTKNNNLKFQVINIKTDPDKILSIVKSKEYTGVILLGSAGLRLARILTNLTEIPIVTGSNNITTRDAGLTGVSILSDPLHLLDFIHQLLPQHTNLMLITDPENESEYLQNLREQVKTIGMKLTLIEANNLQEASRQYDSLLPRLNKKRDIVWLPMDSNTMETGTLFPAVLMKAWEYQIPIVSPTISHTGVMIGAYPAPQAYGRQIANLLLANIKEVSTWKPKVEYAKQLNLTYNKVFASHLDIQLPAPLRQRVFKIYE